MALTESRIQEIISLTEELTSEEQNQLIRELKFKRIFNLARKLDHSVQPNRLTMKEIVTENRKARSQRKRKNV